MIYSHGVDWAAAEKKIRRDAQRDFDRFVWGDVPEPMIIDDPVRQDDVYSYTSQDSALRVELSQWIQDTYSDLRKRSAANADVTVPGSVSGAAETGSDVGRTC
jgi:hypothetical protein